MGAGRPVRTENTPVLRHGLPYDADLVTEKVVQPGVVTEPVRSVPPLRGAGPLRSTISYPAGWWSQ
jgi:hypothetical protein